MVMANESLLIEYFCGLSVTDEKAIHHLKRFPRSPMEKCSDVLVQ